MNLRIRKAVPADVPAIIELMREFAEYEDLLEYLEVTAEKLSAAMFGEKAFVGGVLAVDDTKPVAYALFLPYFSSFRGQKSIYLEDIFITEKYRRYGLGEKMLNQIARIGKETGAVRMDFQVLKWNTPAVNFYTKHGARMDPDERHFKFIDEAFEQLAGD